MNPRKNDGIVVSPLQGSSRYWMRTHSSGSLALACTVGYLRLAPTALLSIAHPECMAMAKVLEQPGMRRDGESPWKVLLALFVLTRNSESGWERDVACHVST